MHNSNPQFEMNLLAIQKFWFVELSPRIRKSNAEINWEERRMKL